MRVREKQINEMITATMKLAQGAASLELPMVSCLYRMVLMELTNLSADPPPAAMARERLDAPVQ